MEEPKWVLADAIAAILDSGVTPTDLSHELGFQDTSMVYRYKKGTTKSMGHIRALIIYQEYNQRIKELLKHYLVKREIPDNYITKKNKKNILSQIS